MEILLKHSNRTYKKVTAFLIMVHTCRESINTGLNYVPEWWNSGLIKTDKIRIPDLPSSIWIFNATVFLNIIVSMIT